MKALILNSGLGSRMGVYTKEHPKCMTNLIGEETILSRQLKFLEELGVKEVVITTGYYDKVLIDYCSSLNRNLKIDFVKNPIYDKTNYIYSIYCAKDLLDNQEIIMMHGDLVFDKQVLKEIIASENSCMAVSTTEPLPEKDFKAVIDGNRVKKVGVEFFENALFAQALYKLKSKDWKVWLDKIEEFCKTEKVKCYAENAFNEISDNCEVFTHDVKNLLCAEIDNPEDLANVIKRLI